MIDYTIIYSLTECFFFFFFLTYLTYFFLLYFSNLTVYICKCTSVYRIERQEQYKNQKKNEETRNECCTATYISSTQVMKMTKKRAAMNIA